MKHLFVTVFIAVFVTSYSQNNVGIGTNTPDASALLDLSANDKGILFPRLSTAQRLAITSPANGLMVFDTDIDCFHYYSSNSGQWENLCSGAGGANGADGVDGIGITNTTDNGDGTFTFTYSDGSSFTTSDLTGPQGANGTNGSNGTDGNDGTDGVGITNTTDNGDGTFTFTYSDGSTFTTSDLTGPQGPAGAGGGASFSITGVSVNTDGNVSVSTDEPATYTSTEEVWTTTGNANTSVTNNFIGTTDAVDFAIRTNNSEQLRVTSSGQVIINNTTANATDKLSVYHIDGVAIGGYSMNNTANNSVGVYGVSTGVGVDNYAVYGYANGGGTNSTSIFGIADGGATAVGGVITSGIAYPAVWGFASNALGTGVIGTNNGSSNVTRFHTSGSGGAFTGTDIGIFAVNYNDLTGSVIVAQSYASGGAGATYNWDIGTINGGLVYKIIGDGTVSTIVEGETESDRRVMFCPEAPEILFEDYGTGQLVNGYAKIMIDPIFSKNITVDEEHPLKVFIQLEGQCEGVYVTSKSATSFVVIELNNGTSNVKFTYHIVANRANDDKTNPNMVAEYEDARFPVAPKKDESKGNQNYQRLKAIEPTKR